MTVFDDAAEQFTRATDRAIATNGYLRGQLILGLVKANTAAGGTVLDYGCGPGRLAQLIAREGYSVRAGDPSEPMIAQATRLDCKGLDLMFETMGEDYAIQPNSCDAIVCSSVIEYVPDPAAVLQSFLVALRRPGVLVISYANKSSLWRRYWERKAKVHPMYDPNNQTWDWPAFKGLLAEHDFVPTAGPLFTESPCDRYRLAGSLMRRSSLAGTIGILAARPTGGPR